MNEFNIRKLQQTTYTAFPDPLSRPVALCERSFSIKFTHLQSWMLDKRHNPLRRFATILHLSHVVKRRRLENDLSHAIDPTGRVRRSCSMLCMLGKKISLHVLTDSACPQVTSAYFLHFSILSCHLITSCSTTVGKS